MQTYHKYAQHAFLDGKENKLNTSFTKTKENLIFNKKLAGGLACFFLLVFCGVVFLASFFNVLFN